jgi:polysaccharide export outer membrane protein
MKIEKNRFHKLIHLRNTMIVGGMLLFIGLIADRTLGQTDSDQYIIGVTDKLSVKFWQQPDLNSDVRVNENGYITLPVVGEIKAAGITTSALSKKIIQQMSFYNASVSQATVTVVEFNSQSVVVGGQVVTPGRMGYENIPDIWKVILDAGGPTQQADLSHVTIVRKEGDKSEVIPVDLNKIINGGDLSMAPGLQPGDLVNVATLSLGGVPLGGNTTKSGGVPSFTGKNVYYVIGAVMEQGPESYEEGIDVLDGINVAHGITPEADLSKVRVIVKGPKYSSVIKVDLNHYIEHGKPERILLHPEDTIVVPSKRSGTFIRVLNVLAVVAPVVGAVGTAILLTRRSTP